MIQTAEKMDPDKCKGIQIDWFTREKKFGIAINNEELENVSEDLAMDKMLEIQSNVDYFKKYSNFGVATRGKIPKEDAKEAARGFSEGRKTLEELLIFCIENEIQTFACCAGHPDSNAPDGYSTGYVAFDLEDEKTKSIVLELFSKGIKSQLERRQNDLALYVNRGNEDEEFSKARKALEEIVRDKGVLANIKSFCKVQREMTIGRTRGMSQQIFSERKRVVDGYQRDE